MKGYYIFCSFPLCTKTTDVILITFVLFRAMDQQQYNYLLRSQLSTVAGLDYNKVECLQRKRLLAFVNHFVSHTAQFLSTFTIQVEQRLDKINSKMNRLENELALLEFKLQSVPRLNDSMPTNTSETYENNAILSTRKCFIS